MLLVLFQLGPHRYALDASRVVEIVPLLALRRGPQSPRGMAGHFVYHGQPVPALDLCELTLGRPAVAHLSTRILIVQHHQSPGRVEPGPPCDDRPGFYAAGRSQLIGLIAERVTGTLRRDAKELMAADMTLASAPFLESLVLDDQGVIQLLDAQKFLDAGAPQPRIGLDPARPESQALRGQLHLTPSLEANDGPD
jgi:chemotaxis-related protein WspB